MAPERLAAHQERAGQVGLDDRLPALEGDLLGRADELAAGVIEQAVDCVALGQHPLEQRRDLGFVADVAGHGCGAAPGGDDLIVHALQLAGCAPGKHDMRAQRGQLVRGGAADPAATAGYDDRLPREQP